MTSLVTRHLFHDKIEDISNEQKAVQQASKTLKNSKNLSKVFEIILAYGNYMNGQTIQGGAYGFKLESLLKINDVKSCKKGITLLHYILEVIEINFPELLEFRNELRSVEAAAKVDWPDVKLKLSTVASDLEVIKKLLDNEDVEESFKEKFKPFYESSTQKIETLSQKIKESEKDYVDVLAFFGEPTTTPTYCFFTLWGTFLSSVEEALIENAKRIKKRITDLAYEDKEPYVPSELLEAPVAMCDEIIVRHNQFYGAFRYCMEKAYSIPKKIYNYSSTYIKSKGKGRFEAHSK